MQGVIIKYKEEKEYGFILDENYKSRFFHISEIVDRRSFQENNHDYLYSEFYNKNCYLVEFDPSNNNKGLIAQNIYLTNQTLNSTSESEPFKAKVTDLGYDIETFTRIVQGIKKTDSIPPGTTKGSDGTYRLGYPEVFRELNLSFKNVEKIGWGTIEIRDLVLYLNNRKRITNNFIERLKNKLIGTTIEIYSIDNRWVLVNNAILKL